MDSGGLYWCGACHRGLTQSETRTIGAGSGTTNACGACGGLVTQEQSRVVRPLAGELARSVALAFRPITLAITLAVLVLSGFTSFVPIAGGLLATGLRFGYLFAVLRSASAGQETVSLAGEDAGSIVAWFMPAVRMIFVVAIAYGPAVALGLSFHAPVLGVLFALLGTIYLPAAVIVAAHADGMGDVLNPVTAFYLIARIPGPYAIACGMVVVLLAVSVGLFVAVLQLLGTSVLGLFFAPFFALQSLVCVARLLGTLVHENREMM